MINFTNSPNQRKYITLFFSGDRDRFLPNLINPFAFLNECVKTQTLQHKSCNCILNDDAGKLNMGRNSSESYHDFLCNFRNAFLIAFLLN